MKTHILSSPIYKRHFDQQKLMYLI